MLLRIGQRPDHGFDEPLGLLSDCHRRIEHFLEVLVQTTARAQGGALTEAQRRDIDVALTYFTNAAPKHTADEEQSLFPRLRASSDPEAQRALDTVARLEHDHDIANTHHRLVEDLFERWTKDDRLTDGDLTELRTRLAALQEIYTAHIAVEDRELFPAAGRVLAKDDIAAIGREMAARRGRQG